MWKKIVPLAAVLIVAWIVLNLFSSPDTPEADAVATDDTGVTTEAESEVVEASDADSSAEEAKTSVAETSEAAEADTAAGAAIVSAAATDSLEDADVSEAEAQVEAEGEVEAETADAAVTEAQTQAESETAEAETEISEAEVAANTADDSSNVQMRYPTDPVTGLTVYDQGMVEVIVEPEPEVIEEEPTTEATDAADTGDTVAAETTEADEQTTETTEEELSAETEPADGPVTETTMEMRYPTDPVTGATVYEGGPVEVAIESVVAADDEDTADAGDAAGADSAAQTTEGRLPVDPETGATIYPDAPSDETAAASSDPEAGASTSTEGADSDRLPTDPVTGATVYETAESGEAATNGQTADGTTENTSETVASSLVTTFTPAQNRSADIGGISRRLGTVFGTTADVLTKSIDESSATNALPRLESASNSLNEVSEQFKSLPDYAISPIGKVVQTQMARLRPMADTAMSKAGVGPVLSPVLTSMMEQMGSMAQ